MFTHDEAIAFLNTLPRNTVREAATYYFDADGADWDGKELSLLRWDQWHRYNGPTALPYGLARYLKKNPQ